ncbi:unnamed protein product [Amoebophrya sp. A120]|nr:unnamed protein product [Amoebophrya sp. A120]|eukprot:GSA120T00004118001.1
MPAAASATARASPGRTSFLGRKWCMICLGPVPIAVGAYKLHMQVGETKKQQARKTTVLMKHNKRASGAAEGASEGESDSGCCPSETETDAVQGDATTSTTTTTTTAVPANESCADGFKRGAICSNVNSTLRVTLDEIYTCWTPYTSWSRGFDTHKQYENGSCERKNAGTDPPTYDSLGTGYCVCKQGTTGGGPCANFLKLANITDSDCEARCSASADCLAYVTKVDKPSLRNGDETCTHFTVIPPLCALDMVLCGRHLPEDQCAKEQTKFCESTACDESNDADVDTCCTLQAEAAK